MLVGGFSRTHASLIRGVCCLRTLLFQKHKAVMPDLIGHLLKKSSDSKEPRTFFCYEAAKSACTFCVCADVVDMKCLPVARRPVMNVKKNYITKTYNDNGNLRCCKFRWVFLHWKMGLFCPAECQKGWFLIAKKWKKISFLGSVLHVFFWIFCVI